MIFKKWWKNRTPKKSKSEPQPKAKLPESEFTHAKKKDNLPETLGRVTFSILADDSIYIDFAWKKREIAAAYGELLYKINNGDFAGQIIHALLQRAVTNIKDADIISEIIAMWQMIQTAEENKPLISPSDVFGSPHLQRDKEQKQDM